MNLQAVKGVGGAVVKDRCLHVRVVYCFGFIDMLSFSIIVIVVLLLWLLIVMICSAFAFIVIVIIIIVMVIIVTFIIIDIINYDNL